MSSGLAKAGFSGGGGAGKNSWGAARWRDCAWHEGSGACERLQTFQGTHPLPSAENVRASGKIVQLAKQMTENDLVLVIVSGGGSALMCWPQSECEQGRRLYQNFLRAGGSIVELNTVRRHLSALKGGGLAAMLYPATVVGLIFSDVPGDNPQAVASGPTYRDETTVEDARRILGKYGLGGYALRDTRIDAKYPLKSSGMCRWFP